MKKIIYTIIIGIIGIIPVFAEEEEIQYEIIINNIPLETCNYNNEISTDCNLGNNGAIYHSGDGVYHTTTFFEIDFIDAILKSDKFTGGSRICYYDINKQFISFDWLGSGTKEIELIIPDNANYMRISYPEGRFTLLVSSSPESQFIILKYSINAINETITKLITQVINQNIILLISIGLAIIGISIYIICKIWG